MRPSSRNFPQEYTVESTQNCGSETVCRMEPSPAQRAARDRIAAELAAAGFALPGTLTVRAYACRKPGCRCLPAPVRQREQTPRPARRTPGPPPRNNRGGQSAAVTPAEPEPHPPENVGYARLTCGQPSSQTCFAQVNPKREDLTDRVLAGQAA